LKLINHAKFLEMIVYHPHRKRQFTYPNVIPGIKCVHKLNILGVTVSDTLAFHNHVDVVVEKTARCLYAIRPFERTVSMEMHCWM